MTFVNDTEKHLVEQNFNEEIDDGNNVNEITVEYLEPFQLKQLSSR